MGRRVGGKRTARGATLEHAVLRHARERPQDGQAKAARELARGGVRISPAGVRYIWRKHGLETAYKRLRAIGSSGAGSRKLTPGQIGILRRGEATRRLVQRSRQAGQAEKALAPDERRNQILLAAAELFVKHGYAGTSMRDIAKWVGLLPGSVYHYFPAKEDLFAAVSHEGFRQLGARIAAAVSEGRTPRERLEAACTVHIEAMVGRDPIARFAGTALFAIHEQQLQRRTRVDNKAYDELFRKLIDDLKLPRGTNRAVLRLSLFGALNWTQLWYKPGKLTPREIAAQIVAMLCGRPRARS